MVISSKTLEKTLEMFTTVVVISSKTLEKNSRNVHNSGGDIFRTFGTDERQTGDCGNSQGNRPALSSEGEVKGD